MSLTGLLLARARSVLPAVAVLAAVPAVAAADPGGIDPVPQAAGEHATPPGPPAGHPGRGASPRAALLADAPGAGDASQPVDRVLDTAQARPPLHAAGRPNRLLEPAGDAQPDTRPASTSVSTRAPASAESAPVRPRSAPARRGGRTGRATDRTAARSPSPTRTGAAGRDARTPAGAGRRSDGGSRTAARGKNGPATAPDADRGPRTDRRAGAHESRAGQDRSSGSPLTRTVTDVLEVVPERLRLALLALAALAVVLAGSVAGQTLRARRLVRQGRRLAADVGLLQSALLPQLPPRIGRARVTAAYRPADGLAAGGDFFDAFPLSGDRTAVIVGDVSGHGRAVVPLTAHVRYTIRAYLEAGASPREALDLAASVLDPHLEDLQVTVLAAIFDPASGRLCYASAGHWPPILVGVEHEAVTACASPPLGAGVRTGRRQTTVGLPAGATVCLHTDGLGDAVGADGRLGPDGVADEVRALDEEADAHELLARIVGRTTEQPDDMLACLLTVLPGAAPGGLVCHEELEVDAAMVNGPAAERFLAACGVSGPHLDSVLTRVRQDVARAGAAIIEVRMGGGLVEAGTVPAHAATVMLAPEASGAPAAAIG